jgi:hypothetical protein
MLYAFLYSNVLLFSSGLQFLFVKVPKYFNFAHFERIYFLTLYCDALHCVHKDMTSAYF